MGEDCIDGVGGSSDGSRKDQVSRAEPLVECTSVRSARWRSVYLDRRERDERFNDDRLLMREE